MRFKRVNFGGPGDDPDEYWFECPDCGGTGEVGIPVYGDTGLDEGVSVSGTCPGCNGIGFIGGDADDLRA